MKKKLLSLVLAGAMVASTSVSAFADVTTVTTDGQQVPVTIKGSVNGQGNKPAPGTLSVTVPTTLSFIVKNDGSVEGSYIKVQNNGTQPIKVYAYEFVDKTESSGITVHNTGDLSKKSDVSLTLSGRDGIACFNSETISATDKGVYTSNNTKGTSDGVLISNISIGQSDDLNLEGRAGTGALDQNDTEGITDTFTLKLKIKKAE